VAVLLVVVLVVVVVVLVLLLLAVQAVLRLRLLPGCPLALAAVGRGRTQHWQPS
jgi:hypothetical protein